MSAPAFKNWAAREQGALAGTGMMVAGGGVVSAIAVLKFPSRANFLRAGSEYKDET